MTAGSARARVGRAALAAVTSCWLTVVGPAGGAVPATVAASPVGTDAVLARYEHRIPVLMAREHIPGLAVALVDGDHVVWQKGFGTTADGSGRPVTVDTMFSVQSMSKLFTATAVMQAVQAGRLDLDVPITTYLPGFRVHSAFEAHPERRITLRMLLSHTAGFTHEAPLGNNYGPEPGDFDAHVRSISDTWLRFPVGTGYAYSNLGIDLAGRILEKAWHEPFAVVMHDSLLAPLGMDHSTFDRYRVHATANRAVGHSSGFVPPPLDVPMTAAGGLWTTAADLARFLRFQLGDGIVDGRTVLDANLMTEMRTVPAPDAGAPAGYALGVARTRWRAGHNLDLFTHGGGGYGFLSDLWWLPRLQLGIAVLTSSDQHDLQGTLSLGILRDLVNEPASRYHARFVGLPAQSAVDEPDSHFVPPSDLSALIATAALPVSDAQARRLASYAGHYRTGELGSMDPSDPASQFFVASGVPYFDAGEDGTAVRHRLTEVRPGLFLAENGETLDLRDQRTSWRGMHLTRVADGPLAVQWALIAGVSLAALTWLVGAVTGPLRRRRRASSRTADEPWPSSARAVAGRRVTATVAALGALAALVVVAGVVVLPGLVDVGFLGGMAFPLPLRLALHAPLAVTALAVSLGALLVVGTLWHWWAPGVRARDAILVVALGALAAQVVAWHMVGWGF